MLWETVSVLVCEIPHSHHWHHPAHPDSSVAVPGLSGESRLALRLWWVEGQTERLRWVAESRWAQEPWVEAGEESVCRLGSSQD